MNDSPEQARGKAFGGVADAYHRGRPTYGEDAAAWLTGPSTRPLSVLELGAGTGKLTERLLALGHDVHATDPDAAMLARLQKFLPHVRTSVGSAEEIDSPDHAYDVVVAAQCLHWFDPGRALPEITRVLRQGGTFSAVWNIRDERIPWVRKLGRIIGTQESLDSAGVLRGSELFEEVAERTFAQWQVVDRRSIQDLVLSRSNVVALPDAERAQLMTDLLALYDDYGRGMDGMQLPYRTACFRARVAPRPVVEPDPGDHLEPTVPLQTGGIPRPNRLTDSASTLPRVVLEPDDDAVLLIDFR